MCKQQEHHLEKMACLQGKLKEFLALMPRDAVAAAKEQAFVPM